MRSGPRYRASRSPKSNLHLDRYAIPGLKLIGRSCYDRAYPPLPVHRHPSIAELCYLEKGEQSYQVDGQEYHIGAGELFLSAPGEIHQSASTVQERCVLYFLWLEPQVDGPFLGLPEAESLFWRSFLCTPSKRVFHPRTDPRGDFEAVLYADSNSAQAAGTRVLSAVLSILLALKDSANAGDEPPLSQEIVHCLAVLGRTLHRPLDIDELAAECGLSVSRFKTRFREETGLAPGEYQLKLRMQQAKYLLSETDMRIIDIALEMGYSSSQHFASVFKRAIGRSPSEWRRISAESPPAAMPTVLDVDDLQEIPPV